MEPHQELKERREANEYATNEFHRVKEEKLRSELSKKTGFTRGTEEEKKKDREMANRASAAASRAKIVCYSKELERRTDRLEIERNRETVRADHAIKKLNTMKKQMQKLKKVLRDLWEMKEERTCSYLFNSDILPLLGPRQDTESSLTDPEEDHYEIRDASAPLHSLSPQIVTNQSVPMTPCRTMLSLPAIPQPTHFLGQASKKPNSRSNVTDVRHLINQTPTMDRV